MLENLEKAIEEKLMGFVGEYICKETRNRIEDEVRKVCESICRSDKYGPVIVSCSSDESKLVVDIVVPAAFRFEVSSRLAEFSELLEKGKSERMDETIGLYGGLDVFVSSSKNAFYPLGNCEKALQDLMGAQECLYKIKMKLGEVR